MSNSIFRIKKLSIMYYNFENLNYIRIVIRKEDFRSKKKPKFNS